MATGYGPASTLHVFVQQDLCTCSTVVSFSAHQTACFALVWSHGHSQLVQRPDVDVHFEASHIQVLKVCMRALQTIRNALPSGR